MFQKMRDHSFFQLKRINGFSPAYTVVLQVVITNAEPSVTATAPAYDPAAWMVFLKESNNS